MDWSERQGQVQGYKACSLTTRSNWGLQLWPGATIVVLRWQSSVSLHIAQPGVIPAQGAVEAFGRQLQGFPPRIANLPALFRHDCRSIPRPWQPLLPNTIHLINSTCRRRSIHPRLIHQPASDAGMHLYIDGGCKPLFPCVPSARSLVHIMTVGDLRSQAARSLCHRLTRSAGQPGEQQPVREERGLIREEGFGGFLCAGERNPATRGWIRVGGSGGQEACAAGARGPRSAGKQKAQRAVRERGRQCCLADGRGGGRGRAGRSR